MGHNQAFKNCTPFIKCFTKAHRTTITDAEDLNLVLSMYNLIDYSLNYSDTADILWFQSKDEATNFDADIANIDAFNSLTYKAKFLGNTVVHGANGFLKNIKIALPLKYLSNFW